MLRSSRNIKTLLCYNFHRNYSDQARIVIAGSGCIGNSVAYNLTKLGWNDIIILEQNQIKSGTSHFSTGMIGLLKPYYMRTVILESLRIYRELEKLGYDVGLKNCGSISLAQSQDREIQMKRRMSYSKVQGLDCEWVIPGDIQKLHPFLNVDDLKGGIYVPDDCYADATKICDALIDAVKKSGVTYRENCQVKYVLTDSESNVTGVETDKGVIKCEYFVNAAGMWARELGFQCKKRVNIPAYPAEHFYLTTSKLDLPSHYDLPCIRDYDSSNYSRQIDTDILIGWYEDDAQDSFEGKVPRNWIEELQENAHKHLEKIWDRLAQRYPVLNNLEHAPVVKSSPDTYTPDTRWILGESPEVNNYFVAVGTNGNSIQGAGGIGKAVAEWIVAGHPTQELFAFSLQRFLELHNNRNYLSQRVKEIVSKHYQITYPHQSEYKYARRLRTSPLFSCLEQRGGVFGTKMAYERALYFDTTYKRGDPLPTMPEATFFKPKFFNFLVDEYAACRETVGIIDISSFSKIKIKSSNTAELITYLQKLCCNNINIEIGTCVKTGMLNKRGGYENECVIVRQAENKFFMISPSSQQTRILEWMNKNLPINNKSIKLLDHTSSYTVLNVVGPKSFPLLSELTNSDVNLQPFHYKVINVGFASEILVLSYTHTGEPGYCLYIPSEYAIHVYEELIKVGKDYGVKDVGTITQRFMRIERFIPFMGEELTSVVTPLESGQEYYIDFNKDFLGKEALLQQKHNGIKRKLVMFLLEDFDVDADIWPVGSEPIFRNSEYVGHVTTACFGFTSDKMVCFGYVSNNNEIITPEFIMNEDALYHVEISSQLYIAIPHITHELYFLKHQDELRAQTAHYRPQRPVFSVKKRY